MSRKKKREWIRSFEIRLSNNDKNHYEVTSVLYPSGFPEASTKLVTQKRYSDFQKLHKALSQIHAGLYLSGTMPGLPKTRLFKNQDYVQERQDKCLELLNFAAQHQQLYNSQVFLNFFATLSSPGAGSLTSEDDTIGALIDQGEIMEAAMASTQIARDDTPPLQPEISSPEPSTHNGSVPSTFVRIYFFSLVAQNPDCRP